MNSSFASLKNHFLIALPSLREGIFAHSITYLCEHDEEGAMGLIINRPLDMSVDQVLEQLELKEHRHTHAEPVYAGGPVHTDRGFVLHRRGREQWDATLDVSSEISLTSSLDILDAIARDSGPQQSLIALGYAGWGPGQLEAELAENTWLTLPAEDAILFEVPADKRVDAALAKLGISFIQLGSDSGHA
ncbi:YqgE/AlgH family protein [Spongiibacter taiwanensis]|uniref:YqgE/AlgH family protein n=1 Tax=Spongiibacter taiwanensis TaxID=1748242 RepID=UPI0020359E4E|nr:YqgE/AlgH family protein [Spongiibacter taiwanensis]USA44794.1 YqgE/AlgH family protein [Spongiibacter taiwanensis]